MAPLGFLVAQGTVSSFSWYVSDRVIFGKGDDGGLGAGLDVLVCVQVFLGAGDEERGEGVVRVRV